MSEKKKVLISFKHAAALRIPFQEYGNELSSALYATHAKYISNLGLQQHTSRAAKKNNFSVVCRRDFLDESE